MTLQYENKKNISLDIYCEQGWTLCIGNLTDEWKNNVSEKLMFFQVPPMLLKYNDVNDIIPVTDVSYVHAWVHYCNRIKKQNLFIL